jgi:YVTN family beta-propeller protein
MSHRMKAFVLGFCGSLLVAVASADGGELAQQLRYPTAAVLSADDAWLLVANQRSGTILLVDVTKRQVAREFPIAEDLQALVATPDRSTWLAIAGKLSQLLRLSVSPDKVEVIERIDVSGDPRRVVVTRDGRRAFVSARWSQRVDVVELPTMEGESAKVVARINLAISPQELLLSPDESRLIAADAFEGQLAIIDTKDLRWLHTSEFPAHNIRGLGVSADGDKLLVAHQMLNELGHTIRNDVHWGLVMTNDLRWLKLASVLTGQRDLYHGAHMHPLGQAGHGSGDPAGLAVASDGRVVVTLGGSGEIATGREEDFRLASAKVGRRPTGVAIASDSRTAYVLNTFDDSVSVVDLDEAKVTQTISLGPAPKPSLAERGEQLFYDARLSHDSWMSCHSCHTDGHTNGQRNDNFSDQTFGAPKRVLSLLTSMDSAPFGWLGSAKTLEKQIEKSIVHTMQGKEEVDAEVAALAAYLRTLGPPPSTAKLRGEEDAEAIARGEKLFAAQKCATCHAPPTYTTPNVVDVGLKDELDHREFNPPSLLGVGQRRRLLHDARAASLSEVFTHHGHQLKTDLSAEEVADLVEYLRSL